MASSRPVPGDVVDTDASMWLDLAMRQIRIAELKDRLSENLRAVENGDEVVVMDRNRPIARIVPLPRAGRRADLVPPTRAFAGVRDRQRPAAGWSVPSTELLLEERGER
jgi:prevent-host-death family protein